MHFLEWKYLYFNGQQEVIFGSDNGHMGTKCLPEPIMTQFIICQKDNYIRPTFVPVLRRTCLEYAPRKH